MGRGQEAVQAADAAVKAAREAIRAAEDALAGDGVLSLKQDAADLEALRKAVAALRDSEQRATEPVEATFWGLPCLQFCCKQKTVCPRCGCSEFLSTAGGIQRREYAAPGGVGLLFGQVVRCMNPARPDGNPNPKSYCRQFKSWDDEVKTVAHVFQMRSF